MTLSLTDASPDEGWRNASGISKLETYNTDKTRDAALMIGITDISFPDIFESLHAGRDSSDRVLRTIIEGLMVLVRYPIDWTNALISGERPPIDPPWVKPAT